MTALETMPNPDEDLPEWMRREEWKSDDADATWEEVAQLREPWTFEVIVGKTWSGKTNLLRERFRLIASNYHYIIAFNPTSVLSNDYDWLPMRCRRSKWDELVVWKMLSFLTRKVIESGRNSFRIAVIIDDPVGQIDFTKSRLMDLLATKSRHFGMSIFVCVQHYPKLSTVMKGNVRKLWIMQTNERNYEAMQDLVMGFTKTRWVRFAQEFTKDFNCVVYNHAANSERDMYRRTRAPAPGSKKKFRVAF